MFSPNLLFIEQIMQDKNSFKTVKTKHNKREREKGVQASNDRRQAKNITIPIEIC